jgi:hypothetical protein
MKWLFPIVPLALIFFLIGCKDKIEYPKGGFEYPEQVEVKDTNLYYYPLKNIESKRDAFYDTYTYLFYREFDEPNLSIRPQSKETFRLTYSTAFGNSVIISLTNGLITVKKGNIEELYDEDTSHLSEIEKFHWELLKRRFPIETADKKPSHKHYYDSLIKLYPQLVDPQYYHRLYEKTMVRNTTKFTYPVTKISLENQQFDSLIRQINSSGFWTMPYRIDCNDPPTDGDAFTFEANTKKKYQVVSVGGCPGDTSNFTKACQKLIDMAKLNKEIYLVWSFNNAIVDSVSLPDIKK